MIAVQPLPAALTTFKVNLDASSPTLHTITKCDGTTHDARGLYTTTSSYNFGGLSPIALDDTQLLFLAAADGERVDNLQFRDASANLHSINLSSEPGAVYTCVVPVVGGRDLQLLIRGEARGAIALAADVKVVKLLLSREGGAVRALVQRYALVKSPPQAQQAMGSSFGSASSLPKADSFNSLGSSDMLFDLSGEGQGIKRVPSKEQMGG